MTIGELKESLSAVPDELNSIDAMVVKIDNGRCVQFDCDVETDMFGVYIFTSQRYVQVTEHSNGFKLIKWVEG